ncbi:MAG: ABC transporter ATP-binding protein/permease [Cytophagaceae bacterium]|nr:ABC transporter ATP-binding protein/permease [Cytophagaceae bacterium]
MKNLMYLNRYFWRYKWLLMAGVVWIILNNWFLIKRGPLVREGTNEIVRFLKDDGYDRSLFLQATLELSLYIVGASVIAGVCLYFQRKSLIGMSRHIEYDLKNDIYRHYQKLPLRFYKKNNTGDLMNRISEDVGHVRQYLGPSLMYGINMVVLFSIAIHYMWQVSPVLTLSTLSPLPLLVAAIYLVHARVNRQSEAIQKSQSRLATMVQEIFSGIRIVKAFAKETHIQTTFSSESDQYRKESIKLSSIQAFFFPVIMFLIGMSTVLLVGVGGYLIIEGKDNLSLGHITEFLIYLNMLSWPVASLGYISSLIQRAEVSQKRINEFLFEKNEVLSGSAVVQDWDGSVSFEDVSFQYPDTGIQALKGVRFHLAGSHTLAIVGNTGSGKSTVAALIGRQYDAQEGNIRIGKESIKNMQTQDLRRQMGFVPQDVFLFSDTIENNIRFGNEQASESEIREAARLADLDSTITHFPEGYKTILGERGITLSGGQKQRLSIARALVRRPKLLVLDDCLSAVDTHTEHTILSNLQAMKGHTCIIISHRLSSVKLADYILFLDQGRITEQGTHEALMDLNGQYKALYQKQMEEEK